MDAEESAPPADGAGAGEAARAGKDPITRLLDMTLGWCEYVDRTEADYPDSVTADHLYWLYQSVASFAAPFWDAPAESQEAGVRQFLETQILPLLLGKPPQV